MNYKKYDYDGYKIYTIQTDKFKNCFIEINFREDARKINATTRNMLVNLMTYTTSRFSTKRALKIRSEELYDLSFGGEVSRKGYNLLTSFGIDFLNPKYVNEKNYLKDSIFFLFDNLKNPHIEDNAFCKRSFDIIKERLSVSLNQYKERPSSYAFVESKKALFGDSISGVRIMGDERELEVLTPSDVAKDYYNMIDNSCCDILVIGDLDMDKVVSIIQEYFYKPSIVSDNNPFVVENKIQPYHEIVVDSVYHQNQLLLYYQLENLSYFERYFVAPIFQRILGNAGMADKLTKSLRVDNSLCYTCGSSFYFGDLCAVFYVGLSYDNVPLALQKMKDCMKEMVDGKITEEFLESQKEKLLSDIRLNEDNMYALLANYYFHDLSGQALYTECFEEIPKVTIKDIILFAQKMHESFLYILKEKKNEEN